VGDERASTAISNTSIVSYTLVRGVFITLKSNTACPSRVSHELVPGFTSSTACQHQKSSIEMLEICIVIEGSLQLNITKKLDTRYSIGEQ
jgi:hypothetical protein